MEYPNIKKTREERKYSQRTIAELLETTQAQYWLWETGKREIPVSKLKILAKFYKVSIDYLVAENL